MQLDLIHYGASEYNPDKFKPIKDAEWIKPLGGFWGSPVGAPYGWKEWGENNDYGDFSSCFYVTLSGNVLVIDGLADLEKLEWKKKYDCFVFPLFEPLLAKGIDAIWLTEKGERETRFSEPFNLYGWDCESVLVLNKNALKANKKLAPR